MKHLIFIFAWLFTAQMLQAQAIALDSSFAQNGYLKTPLSSGNYNYSTIMDLTPDNQIVLVGRGPAAESGLLFCKYSSNGDSVLGYNFPYGFNNHSTVTAIKALHNGSYLITDYEKTKGLKHINPDGTIDTTFGANGGAPLFYNKIEDILISQDNRIILVGENLNDYPEALTGAYVLAYNMEGHLDSTFGDHGRFWYHLSYIDFFNKVAEQADGKLLIAGCSLVDNEPGFSTLIRLLPNGVRDTSFGVNGLIAEQISGGGENYGLVLQADQKILVCGYDWGLGAAVVIRYLPDGGRDASFGNNGVVVLSMVKEATDILVLPNGKILVYGGLFDSEHHTALIQLLPDGTLDPYFGNAGVFYSPFTDFRPPMKMKLVDGNKLIATGSIYYVENNFAHVYLQMQGFLLNLSVGVLSPRNEVSVWAYPNPIRDAFVLGFSLESPEQLQFDLYDLQGKRVQSLLRKTGFVPGKHTVPIRLADDLSAGNYLLRLSVQGKPAVAIQIVKI